MISRTPQQEKIGEGFLSLADNPAGCGPEQPKQMLDGNHRRCDGVLAETGFLAFGRPGWLGMVLVRVWPHWQMVRFFDGRRAWLQPVLLAGDRGAYGPLRAAEQSGTPGGTAGFNSDETGLVPLARATGIIYFSF